jgi:hypothetical protein
MLLNLFFFQEAVLAVTNTLEGIPFVDASTADTAQTYEYLTKLFPEFRDAKVPAGG